MKSGGLHIDGVEVQVVRKRVKHINLRVVPPLGEVRVSAPGHVSSRTIQAFVRSKLSWIERVRCEVMARGKPSGQRFSEGTRFPLWGQTYPLHFHPEEGEARVRLVNGVVCVPLSPVASVAEKRAWLDVWQREEMACRMWPLFEQWQSTMGVAVATVQLRRMKSRWGSCTPGRRSIRLNLALVHHPLPLLEYVVVHELAHMIEVSHGATFRAVMDLYLPDWRVRRHTLRSLATGPWQGP